MAEIDTSSHSTHKNRRRGKKLSTRVDLTPMVDLGFLLITFFIFTTSMNEPKTLKLKLPADPDQKSPSLTAEGKTLNIVLTDADRLFYYMGSGSEQMDSTGYNPDGIRRVIMQKKKQVAQNYGDADELVILIRPTRLRIKMS
ncbi:MAG TPA: biopolymer transporter ExbD [Flavitalea sp.]|nr:biopolymer transporter ExbD [Flavitalea sp.]